MRLYLVVAMLVLALAAFTQAQEAEAEAAASGIGEMGKNLADKAQATLEVIRTSDIVTNSQTWLEQQLEKVKQKISEITQ